MYTYLIQLIIISFVFHILINPEEIFDWYGRLIHNLPLYLWKPLGGCLKCLTGQVTFWGYLIKYFHSYNLLTHLFFVSLGIIAALILNKLYDLIKNN
jgi:hypothetical protein